MHTANGVLERMGRAGGFVCALVMSMVGFGCSDDGGQVRLSYIVTQSQAIGSVGLLGSSLAVVGTFSNFPDEISADSFPAQCLTPAGTPETGATILTQQSCAYDGESGNTSCTIATDVSSCAYLDGTATHQGLVFENGERVGFTLLLDQFTQGNNDLGMTEIEFDGMVSVETSADTVRFVENVTLTVRTPDESEATGIALTELDIASAFTAAIDLEAGTITIDGDGIYAVGGIGANEVMVTGLVIPLDASECEGPVSGLLRADLVALGNVVEGFGIQYSACNTAQLLRFKNGTQQEAVNIDPVTMAAAFEGTLGAIRGIAGAPQSLVPAATEPFDSDAEVDAFDPADMWCRFLTSEDDLPFVASIEVAAGDDSQGVAECLIFSANVSLATDDPTSERSLLAGVLSLEGPLTDATSIIMLSAHGGVPNWNNDGATLTPATLVKADVTSESLSRASFEAAAAASITEQAAIFKSPFVEDGFFMDQPPIPDFRCLQDNPYADAATENVQLPEVQCIPQLPGPAFDIDFTRLGMWLLADDGTQGLYIRVRE